MVREYKGFKIEVDFINLGMSGSPRTVTRVFIGDNVHQVKNIVAAKLRITKHLKEVAA
jgi:hypothetical protein